jgi:hypothetical protein
VNGGPEWDNVAGFMRNCLFRSCQGFSTFTQRDLAAFLAISTRRFRVIDFALAAPPLRPSSTAALLRPSSVVPDSSISPVAFLMIVTAFLMTSAGRLWPLGVRGMLSGKDTTKWRGRKVSSRISREM